MSAESLHDWIASNIMPFFARFRVGSQSVIEKSFLPLDFLKPVCAALPVANDRVHSRLAWKRQYRVRMIRHKKEELTRPMTESVISAHCIQQFNRQSEFS